MDRRLNDKIIKTPVLFIHDQNIKKTSIKHSEKAMKILKRAGVKIELVSIPTDDFFTEKGSHLIDSWFSKND